MKVIESLAKRECKPVDYEVDALRALMLTGEVSAFGSNHGYHRRQVIPKGSDVIRTRIIFWSVPGVEIELLEPLQISPV